MKKLKILFVSEYYPPKIGGGELWTQMMAQGLAARGHNVHVITSRLPGTKSKERINGVVVHRPFPTGGLFTRLTFIRKLTTYLTAFIKKERIDLVHTNAYIPTPAASIAGKRTNVPVVTSVHLRLGSAWWRVTNPVTALWNVLFEDLIIRCFHHDLVHVTAEPTRRALTRRTNAPVKNIPNYLDPAPFHTYAHAIQAANGSEYGAHKKRLLSINSFLPVKAIPHAVTWVRESTVDAAFLIGGSGPDEARIKRAIGNDQRLKIVGTVQGEQKYRLLAGCDAFVLLSYSEQFSLAALDALALGKEVIATPVGILPELAKSPWRDRVHIVRTQKEFTRALNRVKRRQPQLDHALFERYSKEVILDRFEKEYALLLKKK